MVILMILNKLNTISNNYGGVNSKSTISFELALFVKNFIEFTFNYFNIVQTIHNKGRQPYNLLNVISLLVYGSVNGITSTIVIAENSEYHELYKFVSNNLTIAG